MTYEVSGSIYEPLRESAGPSVHAAIEDTFELATTDAPDYYVFTGYGDDYRFAKSLHPDGLQEFVSAQGVIRGVIQRRNQEAGAQGEPVEPVAVLDVGTARGGFLDGAQNFHGEAVTVSGITATDYRDEPVPNQTYVVGNAEYIGDYFSPASQDVIVSDLTLCHIADPLGTVGELYKLLKPGGVMITNGFDMPGLEGKELDMLATMSRTGIPIFATHNYSLTKDGLQPVRYSKISETESGFNDKSMMVLRRPSADSAFLSPVAYGPVMDEGEVTYRPSTPIPATNLPVQEAVKPLCNDLNCFDPRALDRLDKELFNYPQELVHPSMAQSFLRTWYARLQRPSVASPAWRNFERGAHALFDTVLNGPGIHRTIAQTLQIASPVDQYPLDRPPRWFEEEIYD